MIARNHLSVVTRQLLRLCVWIFVPVVILNGQFKAASPENNFTYLNTLNGLSNDFVNQSIKDASGFLWIATQNGLNRYDGKHIKTYFNNPKDKNSLCGNFVSSLFLDSKKRLWVGVAESGISLYHPDADNFTSFRTNDTLQGSIRSYTYITSFFEDSKHRIWISTWGSGLYQFDESNNSFIQYKHDPKNQNSIYCDKVKCIEEDKDGTLWIGLWAEGPTDTIGIQLFHPSSGIFSNYYHNFENIPGTKMTKRFSSIMKFAHCLKYVAEDNTMWVGGLLGLAKIHLGEFRFETFFQTQDHDESVVHGKTIRQISFTKERNLILSTQENGIIILSKDSSRYTILDANGNSETSLSSNGIRHCFVDSNGQLFVSTSGGGLQISIPDQSEYIFVKKNKICLESGNFNKGINTISKFRNTLYLGTNDGLYFRPDNQSCFQELVSVNKQLKNLKIQSIFNNTDGNGFYFSTEDENLFKYDPQKNLLTTSQYNKAYTNGFGMTRSLIEWNTDSLITVSEFGGVHFYDSKNHILKILNSHGKNLGFWNFARKWNSGNLLIGYHNGIVKYNIQTDSISHCFVNEFPDKIIRGWQCNDLTGSEKNGFWFACDSSVGFLNPASNYYKFYPLIQNHLLVPFFGIQQDEKGNLWLHGEFDIFHFDTTSKIFSKVQSRLIKFNYPNAHTSFLDPTSGMLYVPGLDGYKLVNTRLFYNDKSLHPLKIVEIQLNGKAYTSNPLDPKILKLKHDENSLSIYFSNFDFEKNKNYTIEYKIIPIQENWQSAPENQIIELNNLKPGNYTLQIKYKNLPQDHTTTANLSIEIAKPYWMTIWFLSICILVFSFIIRFLIQYNLKRLAQKNAELEAKVSERTIELQKQKKESEDLLLNILPENIVEELKIKGYTEARLHENVTVLFSDFVNFSGISAQLEPTEIVREVDKCFKAFDQIIESCGLEKIKTIGDCYMAVGGLNNSSVSETINTVRAAKEFIKYVENNNCIFKIRVGIHTGSVIAGVVGFKKFAYDIWGDTVNIASRMETNGIPMRINISKDTYTQIQSNFSCEYRGKVDTKNTGELEMYLVSD